MPHAGWKTHFLFYIAIKLYYLTAIYTLHIFFVCADLMLRQIHRFIEEAVSEEVNVITFVAHQ